MTQTEQRVMDDLAEAVRNLLAYGSRYNYAAKQALKRYEALTPKPTEQPEE